MLIGGEPVLCLNSTLLFAHGDVFSVTLTLGSSWCLDLPGVFHPAAGTCIDKSSQAVCVCVCVDVYVNANLPFQGPGPSPPPPWIYFTSPYCHPRMSPPWSNFLSAIIWWVRTASHWQVQMTLGLGRSWLLNMGLAPYQAPVCLVLTAPTGLATGGGLLGQLATEGCNHSLWHIWHRLSICSTTERAVWASCLILLGQEMATLRWVMHIRSNPVMSHII